MEFEPYLDSSSKRLVGFGELVVSTAEVLVLNLQFSEVGLVLLLGTTKLSLVLGLNVDDRALQFLCAPQTSLPAQVTSHNISHCSAVTSFEMK